MNMNQPHELAHLYDAQIDAHFAQIRILRERRNADCSQTRRLPQEIFSRIFGILRTSCYRSRYPHLEWKAVTHVCRTWRNSALNEPTLWTDFIKVHPNWVREIFARSKAAPLRLCYRDCGYPSDVLDFIVEALVRSPERIKELRIFEYGEHSFIDRLVKPAPFLESLVVDFGTPVNLPLDFLAGVAPRLRSIKCNGNLPLEASWLASLRSLDYSGVLHIKASWLSKLTSLRLERGATCSMSIDTLLSALENTPLLQCLRLVASPGTDDAPCHRSTPVHLRHLDDITFDLDSKPSIAKVFIHLRVDNIEKLRTSWPYQFGDISMIEHVCHFFNTCYRGDHLQYVAFDPHLGLEMHRCIDLTGPAVHTPSLVFQSGWSDPSIIVNLLPQCVPRILSTSLYPEVKALVLTECDTIEELRISSGYPHCYHFESNDASSPPYPSLQRLRIGRAVDGLGREETSQLTTWLSRRDPKVEVVIRECGLSREAVDALRAVALLRFEAAAALS